MMESSHDKNIEILTYAEIEDVKGYIGNFEVRIRKKARSVDISRCTGCGQCIERCPLKVPSEWDLGLGSRKAIYVPFPQAVPNVPVIDREHCFVFTRGRMKCRMCERVCSPGAVDFNQEDEVVTERFGAIVVASGLSLFAWERPYGEYGAGQYKDVITSLHLERMLQASGPTEGSVLRPSDGKEPQTVVFIQCVGSRDAAKGVPYCSGICCMYTAKHAMLLKEHLPHAQAYVFYIDIRATKKQYEEFINRVQREYGAIYVRGRVSRVYERGDKLVVEGADTLAGTPVEVEADLVVLATAVVPQPDAIQLARILGIPYDQYGIFTEAHPKLRPVESVTGGIFLAGACQGSKDIPEVVATAGAAAVKVCGVLARDELALEPTIAEVDLTRCSGCLTCVDVCPFGAIREVTVDSRTVARVTESLCTGCGTCAAACRAEAITTKGFSDAQLYSQISAALERIPEEAGLEVSAA